MTTGSKKYGPLPKILSYIITGVVALLIYWLVISI